MVLAYDIVCLLVLVCPGTMSQTNAKTFKFYGMQIVSPSIKLEFHVFER